MKALFLLPVLAALLVVEAGIRIALSAPTTPVEQVPPARPAYAVVVPVANVHIAPDANSPVIMQVLPPAILYATAAQQPTWRYVSGVNWQGWVAAGDLTPETFLVPDTRSAPTGSR